MTPRPPTVETDRARFMAKIDPTPSGCWEWRGALANGGYGSFHLRGRNTTASHAAWLLFRGSVPIGHEVCHSCDNPPCANPAHLWTGTRGDNMRDAQSKGRLGGPRPHTRRASCPRGHPRNYDRWGNCRDCARAFDRTPARRARKSAVRALAPMLPQSPLFARALEADELPVIDVATVDDPGETVDDA